MVRSYTDKELLDYVKALPSFNGFPGEPWLLFVRSKEDTNDRFDDKVYMFQVISIKRVHSLHKVILFYQVVLILVITYRPT